MGWGAAGETIPPLPAQRVSRAGRTPGIPIAAKRSKRWSPATSPLHGLSFETWAIHKTLL